MSQSRWQEKGTKGEDCTFYKPPRRGAFLKRPLFFFLFAFGLIGLGWGLWAAYSFFTAQSEGEILPLIRAEEGPYKVRPEDPHTHKIPHTEKTIYDHFSREKESESQEVKLRSLPAEPMKEGPSLPADFFQAFSDAGQGGSLPLFEAELMAPTEEKGSPFKEGEMVPRDFSPFAEKDGFFEKEGVSERGRTQENQGGSGNRLLQKEAKEAADQQSLKAFFPNIYPSSLVRVTAFEVQGSEEELYEDEYICLELFQEETEKGAKEKWRQLKSKSSNVLAAYKVDFKKIDHGKKMSSQNVSSTQNGILYHVLIPKILKTKAIIVREELKKQGLSVCQLLY